MSKKPGEQALNELFEEVVKSLKIKLKSEDCPVSAISAAIQLLRDNDIQCDPEDLVQIKSELGDKLNLIPFPKEGIEDGR